jgi:hypothetical protein
MGIHRGLDHCDDATVLLVGGLTVERVIMASMLTGFNCTVDSVPCGKDILTARSKSYDLILVDSRLFHKGRGPILPLIDEARRRFSHLHGPKHVPTVVFSATKSSGLPFADAHIRVPFQTEEVRRIVALYCGFSRADSGERISEAFATDDANESSFAAYLDRVELGRALVTLRAELDAFVAASNGQEWRCLARRAHAIISSARILGFLALAKASQHFEQCVVRGAACDRPYRELLAEIDLVGHRIDRRRATTYACSMSA